MLNSVCLNDVDCKSTCTRVIIWTTIFNIHYAPEGIKYFDFRLTLYKDYLKGYNIDMRQTQMVTS